MSVVIENFPSPSAASTVTVGEYLAIRLRQCGVEHLFGLPGDFNLALLDELLAGADLTWVNSTNELNAAYAADGYARARGFGALVTTYGVGELSAVNGIAGAAAERVPVLQITGAPATPVAEAGMATHHTLADGDFDRFGRMYSEVTVAAATVTGAGAGATIDRVITAMLTARRPGYLRIPTDAVGQEVSAEPLSTPLTAEPRSDAARRSRFATVLRESLQEEEPVILLGHLADRFGLAGDMRRLADTGRVRIVTFVDAKGLVPETHPAHAGVYVGAFTPDPRTRSLVENASLVITVGVVLGDLLTGMYSHRLGSGSLITLGPDAATVDGEILDGVSIADSVGELLEQVEAAPRRVVEARPAVLRGTAPTPDAWSGDPVTQESFWSGVERWLPAGTPVFAEAGTAFYGAAAIRFPDGARLIGQPIWSSIGYTLPAAVAHGFACDDRPVLFIGDGAAQLSIQDLATARLSPVQPIVFLLDNGGYSVERAIRSPDAVYQDITRWDWRTVVRGLLPDSAVSTWRVRNEGELRDAMAGAEATADSALAFIEVVLEPGDVPPLLHAIANGLGSAAAHELMGQGG
ncbi:alpha-keto acid decarboxylase family protein [Microbacterium sp. 18062]|uniref:alpha-keto acid decarboxylase family protein n=1 Tax=Microbacterium sp. 18062 TaxID=2681410 RepID=UPI00135C7730|nr:thiamine pyrophosphate-binding protein [Microbacterium sp. 18062]